MSEFRDEFYVMGAPAFSEHFTQEAQERRDKELRDIFASGKGIIELSHETADVVIEALIKYGLEASVGRPFTVVVADQAAIKEQEQ